MQTLPAEVPIGNKGDLLFVKANLWLVEHGVVFNLTPHPRPDPPKIRMAR